MYTRDCGGFGTAPHCYYCDRLYNFAHDVILNISYLHISSLRPVVVAPQQAIPIFSRKPVEPLTLLCHTLSYHCRTAFQEREAKALGVQNKLIMRFSFLHAISTYKSQYLYGFLHFSPSPADCMAGSTSELTVSYQGKYLPINKTHTHT